MNPAKAPSRRFTPWHPLVWMVPSFLLVFAVNGVMVYFASTSFTGVSEDHAYEKGLAYNQTLAAKSAAAALGWEVKRQLSSTANGGHVYTLTVTGPDALPVEGLAVTGTLARPLDGALEVPLVFTSQGGGIYQVELRAAQPGQWDLRAELARGDDRMTLGERLVLDIP